MIPVTLFVIGYSYSVAFATNYLTTTFTRPFLQNGVIATHSPKKLATTIQTSLIQYQVLKVPTSKTTFAKK